jgi:hypothetical protein
MLSTTGQPPQLDLSSFYIHHRHTSSISQTNIMIRTQVYLTEQEQRSLRTLAGATGKSQSQLIREAIDRLVEQSSALPRRQILEEAAGMWKNRTDLPDFAALRHEADRLAAAGEPV